jgi:hypothetical protein
MVVVAGAHRYLSGPALAVTEHCAWETDHENIKNRGIRSRILVILVVFEIFEGVSYGILGFGGMEG